MQKIKNIQVRKDAVIKLGEESTCCSIFKWYHLFIMTANTSKDDMIIGSNDVQSQVEATQGVVAKCYEDFIDDNGYIGRFGVCKGVSGYRWNVL